MQTVEAQPELAAFTDDDLEDVHGYVKLAENVGIGIGLVAVFAAGIIAGYAIGAGL